MDQLSFRLRGVGYRDGYLTVTGERRTSEQERRQLAALVALGMGNRAIAEILRIEEDTVKKHLAHATSKLGLGGRTQLAVSWATGERLELPAHVQARPTAEIPAPTA